ncbi:MAG: 5'-nucleotidase C-terminal domain-containing protein [Proteobacteria bacterium]|nr:5'-nucleotidase C-terminal domain-containing protein [Pseudomonadota bacterium]
MKRKAERVILGIALGCMFFSLSLLSSCYAPENIDIIYDDAAQGKMYQFDILALSEWGGRILPEKQRVMLYADQDDYYLLEELGMQSGKLTYNSVELSNTDMEFYIRKPLVLLNVSARKDDVIAIRPFAYAPDLEIECVKADTSGNELLGVFNKTYALNVSGYVCDYAVSGALSMRKTWDRLKSGSEVRHQIYVGNGDSFGVSQRASALFNDLPTPEMLSLMGFQVDTIGNHSFDNRIDYLQNIINFAERRVSGHKLGYSYVATNLENSSALKSWLTHYTAVIPSGESSEEGLRVAFIGALDNSVFSTTKTGSFGSINIDSQMCSIVNEIELAYNENARAFFILGHILTGKESFARLMDALFTFTEPILSESIKSGGRAELHFLSNCESKIVVPNARIREVFGGKGLSQLDFKQRDVKERYARLVDDIRLEIFSGIIGVLGEAVETPSALAYYHEKHDASVGVPGLIWNDHSSSDPGSLDFSGKNMFNAASNRCGETGIFDRHLCYSLKFDTGVGSVYDHPIYYVQFPGKGYYALKLGLYAQRKPSDNGDHVASSYELKVSDIRLYPVLSSLSEVRLRFKSSLIDLLEPSYNECKQLLEKDVSTLLSGEPGSSCKLFFNSMATDTKTYTSITEMKTISTPGKDHNNYQDLFYACHNGFAEHVLGDERASAVSENLKLSSAFWACLYSASSNILCTDDTDSKRFHSPIVFEFKDYQSSTMMIDRSQSTYNTNIISDGFLGYMNQKNSDIFDISVINSGTIRDGDLSEITTNNLPQMIPFDNKLVSASVPVKTIVEMLGNALQASFENQNTDYGGFPSVSRLSVAYRLTKDENDKTQIEITEIWKTDEYGALSELLYVSSIDEHYFADYIYSGSTMRVEFSNSSSPWLCRQQQQIVMDCSNISGGLEYEMKYENGHYYSDKSLNLLSHSFLATGGDGYPNNFGLSNASQLTYYDTSFRSAVYSYYSGTDSSIGEDGSILGDQECVKRESYKTIDGMTPETMECVLYVNHFYNVDKLPKRRWILSASDAMIQYLDNACQASRLGTYNE